MTNSLRGANARAHQRLLLWAADLPAYPEITGAIAALPKRERAALLWTYRPLGLTRESLDMTPTTLSVTLCLARRKIALYVARLK